jgi:hypothetical protein
MKYLIVFLIAVALITLSVIAFFAYMARKYYSIINARKIKKVEEQSPFRHKKPPPRTNRNDFLSRDKVAEKKKHEELRTGVTVYNEKENALAQADDIEIVGVAKPVGFWSRFIMNQKAGYIMARMSFQNKGTKGYWVNLIKAQASSQGKDQSRGR